jgi:hypothetical protein
MLPTTNVTSARNTAMIITRAVQVHHTANVAAQKAAILPNALSPNRPTKAMRTRNVRNTAPPRAHPQCLANFIATTATTVAI